MDLDAYDHMVSGVDSCVTYASNDESGGVKCVKSAYDISAMGMKFKYFVEHMYDPKAQCMVFRLDYGKRSDLDDTVGYWYVDNRGRTSCRVYYSCECKLRGWVPGPVYNMSTSTLVEPRLSMVLALMHAHSQTRLSRSGPIRAVTKEALKKATLWVSHEAIKEWRSSRTHPLVAFVGNVRESLRESLGNLQLPQQPRWIEEGKERAVLFVSALRAQQKSKRANMVEYS